MRPANYSERQITTASHGHILTNIGVWSPDGRWIVYDVRSDPAGSVFDGARIERVHVESGKVDVLYVAPHNARVGVATYHPTAERVIFIHGPENPSVEWSYSTWHRRGVIVETAKPGIASTVDACDLTLPFVRGALRGGSHLHQWAGGGEWISFTYEDHLLASAAKGAAEINQRNIGVSIPADAAVTVDRDHPRNHDGSHISFLVTQTHDAPRPGSDEIERACEEGWIGLHGYLRTDGTRQRRALAFQGTVHSRAGAPVSEVFVVNLPSDLGHDGQPLKVPPVDGPSGPLTGTPTTRPRPPQGCVQRRLTFTTERKHPGLSGPRHWLRSSPDGSRIAFLMKDDEGIVQLWTVATHGGEPRQLTHNEEPISSALTWSSDGHFIAHTLGGCVCMTDMQGGTHKLTAPQPAVTEPRPEACVFSPDGQQIAYIHPVRTGKEIWNQIFTIAAANLIMK